ncbi:hypothetical protein GCN74_16830 [Janthinobacterium sp. FT14W]|uniref:hypothetical protein n=1 Tax=Janthinobacterium sp. FT14W TaxID=2654253 RepID=UPI00126568F1|nr:hypothetical protein [Janthinobacterium sp. FT14W]KAB8058237.1 hypothetical protein GCN74_16830 [Janthinobacterium sp. FT14W]
MATATISAKIRDQLAAASRRRLHKLGGTPPEAERLLTLLDGAPPARQRQLLGDTVLRRAIQHAMRQLQLDDGPIGQHMRGSRRAIDRARYLGEQLHTTIWPELGPAGRHMTRWLLDL